MLRYKRVKKIRPSYIPYQTFVQSLTLCFFGGLSASRYLFDSHFIATEPLRDTINNITILIGNQYVILIRYSKLNISFDSTNLR